MGACELPKGKFFAFENEQDAVNYVNNVISIVYSIIEKACNETAKRLNEPLIKDFYYEFENYFNEEIDNYFWNHILFRGYYSGLSYVDYYFEILENVIENAMKNAYENPHEIHIAKRNKSIGIVYSECSYGYGNVEIVEDWGISMIFNQY